MDIRKIDTERAVNLLKIYKAKLNKSNDRSLSVVMEKLIEILESQVYNALLDIHELYVDTLINTDKEVSADILKEVNQYDEQAQPSTSQIENPKKSLRSEKSQESRKRNNEKAREEVTIVQEIRYEQPQYVTQDNNPPEQDDIEEEDNRWEYFEIQLNKGKKGYGFAVGGGFDKNHYDGDSSIFVTKLVPGGAAEVDGRLRLDDAIMSVNDTNLEYVLHDTAVEILKNAGKFMTLVVRRLKEGYIGTVNPSIDNRLMEQPMSLYSLPQEQYSDQSDHLQFHEFEIILTKKPGAGLGFTVNGGYDNENPEEDSFVYISKITPGGVADADGRLQLNDVLLMVDDVSLHGLPHDDCVSLLKNSGRTVKLFVGRFYEDVPEEALPVKEEKKQKKHRRNRDKD